jgi:Fur family peroxide stress response transcriptional regulator
LQLPETFWLYRESKFSTLYLVRSVSQITHRGIEMKAEGRLTRYRKTVLQVLRSSNHHPTAADVFRIVRRRRPGVAYATIYNALNWLERGGLIASLNFTDEATRYDPIIERHDHFVCTRCGRLTDVELKLPSEIVTRAAKGARFRVAWHRTELFGYCSECTLSGPRALREGS